jgi:catechol 2,3-dioxygenase-like lactoylglutathione lyase family enzyme
MPVEIGSIVWGVKDLPRAVAFWTQALDYRLKRDPDVDFAILVPQEGKSGTQLSLKLCTSERPRRHHIDLFSEDQKGEVARLLRLGAKRKEGWDHEDGADYVVLVDPDGNAFCVVQR